MARKLTQSRCAAGHHTCFWFWLLTASTVLQGSALFWAGFALVVWGWAIIGFCVETYGFFLLFSGFFPTVLSFLRRVPFLDRVLDAPGIKRVGCHVYACKPCR